MLNDSTAFSSFSVDDIEKAKEFYEGKLGLETSDEFNMGMLDLHLKDGVKVMVYPKENHEPATYTTLNFVVDDIDKAVADLKERGVKFEDYPHLGTGEDNIARDPRGPKIAWFLDPAGNTLAIIENRK